MSFPALFCSKLNNESGILAAVCRTNCPHCSYCSQWLLTWRLGHWPKNKHDSWHCSWCERKGESYRKAMHQGRGKKKKKRKITTSLTVKYTVAALHPFKLAVKMLQNAKMQANSHACNAFFILKNPIQKSAGTTCYIYPVSISSNFMHWYSSKEMSFEAVSKRSQIFTLTNSMSPRHPELLAFVK